ncbi:hypothetical protein CRUP_027029, partial [Coryphaenoides rupestris]
PEDDGNDQTKVIVGVVVGLLLAAALLGGIYWIFMKNRCKNSSSSQTTKH